MQYSLQPDWEDLLPSVPQQRRRSQNHPKSPLSLFPIPPQPIKPLPNLFTYPNKARSSQPNLHLSHSPPPPPPTTHP
ncbi:hypothetical protein K470DRAFT_82744 [Piedraia hortae CBS 480.64]|uniref:Uncharacterized protein n=1 Tax=Piedraia hortae CBS 480.64 TaxID=1314780 RepID=A0A6A7C8N3_9PEZI|nr:hypothetical protein K470DRAFT_82744 [Piedraia hortae CBS 480.64]